MDLPSHGSAAPSPGRQDRRPDTAAGGVGSATREHRVVDAFTGLFAALAGRDDVLELLELLTARCAELLGAASAGLLLADGHGGLHVVGSSSSDRGALEALQAQRTGGPWRDCFLTGRPVLVDDLAAQAQRWPRSVAASVRAGSRSAHVVPVRLPSRTLGALGVCGAGTGPLDERDLALALALADVASIALTRDARHGDGVTERVRTVLDGRVALELATGFLAHRADLTAGQALAVLRRSARERRLALSEVAGAVLTGSLPIAALVADVDART